MPAVATRSDALRLQVPLGGAEIRSLHAAPVGPIPGVAVLAVAAINGPSGGGGGSGGAGRVRSYGDGTLLAWRAPGSATFGETVDVSAGGSFLLEDGEDTDKWVRISVDPDWLNPAAAAGDVFLADVYENWVGYFDVTAAQALAGNVQTWSIALKNASGSPIWDLKVWLDSSIAGVNGIQISTDNVNWYAPDAEDHADVLEFGDLAAAAVATLYVKRTIPAAAPSDPDVLNWLHCSWDGF